MNKILKHMFWILFLFGLVWALAGFAVGRATAQEPDGIHGHAEMHDVYRNWHSPSNPNVSCCNGQSASDPHGDCRPTRAYIGDDGLWRAWNGLKWLTIPPSKVLPTDLAGDGRSHLCELDEFIYCFSPASPRS